MAIKRFKAEAGWWDDLTPEEQTKYISEHPDSKLAKNAKAKEKKGSESDTPSEPSSKKTVVKKAVKKVADKTVDTVKKSGNLIKKAHKVVHEWDVKETEHMKHFMRGNDHEPGSTVRRSWGEALRSKATGFVKHMMQDTKEHIHALNALANMPIEKGAWKKISDHDRKSLKILGINLGIFATSLAATGGLGGILHAAAHHGAGAAIQHLAIDYVKEIVITSASRAAVFAAEEKVAKSDKELLEKFYNGFAEYMENGNIDWEKAFSKADGSEAEEKRELPMDRVVSRLQETSALTPYLAMFLKTIRKTIKEKTNFGLDTAIGRLLGAGDYFAFAKSPAFTTNPTNRGVERLYQWLAGNKDPIHTEKVANTFTEVYRVTEGTYLIYTGQNNHKLIAILFAK